MLEKVKKTFPEFYNILTANQIKKFQGYFQYLDIILDISPIPLLSVSFFLL